MGQSAGQTVTQEVDPQYANRLYTLYGDARNYANQTPWTPYKGQGVAGLDPFQVAGQNYLASSFGLGGLGFGSPERYTPNAYGGMYFREPQEYQSVGNDGITRYLNPGGLLDDARNTVINPGGGTPVDPNTDPNLPYGGSYANKGAPQDLTAQYSNEGVPVENTTIGGFNPWDIISRGMGAISDAYGAGPTTGGTTTGSMLGGPLGGLNDEMQRQGYGPAPDYARPTGSTAGGTDTSEMPMTGGMGPWEMANQAAQGNAMGMLGYQAPYASDGMDRYTNPWQQQVIDGTVSDMLDAADMAAEQGIFSKGAGTYGGDRMGVQAAEMQRNTMDRIGNTVSQLRSQGFDTAARNAQMDANRSLSGAGLGLQAGNALNQYGTDALRNTIGTASALNQMGAQNQGLSQRMMDYDRGQFYEQRDYPWQQIGRMQSILSGVPVGMSTYYPGGSIGGGIAGGAMAGYGMGGPWGALAGGGLGLLGGVF